MASGPRIASSSKTSATRSATAIGSARIASRPVFAPRSRNALPSFSPAIASAIEGDFASGGVIALMYARKLATARTFLSNAGYAAASCACRGFSPSAVFAASRPERDGRAVGLRREHPHVGRDQLQAERRQLQVLDHRLAEPADGVRDARRGEPGRDLAVPQDAADLVAPLQQRDVLAGLRQVRRGDQAVVAAADDEHALLRHQATCFPPRFFSFRYSSAAMRPGAPMMPPPGCVAEPHIHRSWTGVR